MSEQIRISAICRDRDAETLIRNTPVYAPQVRFYSSLESLVRGAESSDICLAELEQLQSGNGQLSDTLLGLPGRPSVIVLCPVLPDSAERRALYAAGVADILCVPLSVEELQIRIRSAVVQRSAESGRGIITRHIPEGGAQADLPERTKELKILHEAARRLHRRSISSTDALQRIIEMIPSAFRFPEATAARLVLGEKIIASSGFADGEHYLKQEIAGRDSVVGCLEVVVRGHGHESDVFLTEESDLLQSLAEIISSYHERETTTKEIEWQKEFLANVLDVTPAKIFAKDIDGVFHLVNRAAASLYNTTPEHMVGKHESHFNIRSNEVEAFLQDDREVLTTGRDKFIAEEMVTDAEGNVRWLQTTKRRILTPDGRALVLGSGVDITHIKLATEGLRRGEERYRILARNIPGADMFLYDRDLRIILAEGSEMESTGLSKEELEGRRLHEVLDQKTAGILVPAYRRALDGGSAEVAVTHSGRHYVVRTVPVRDDSGRISAGMALTFNITDQKQSEEQVILTNEKLRTLIEASPLAIVQHDRAGRVILWNRAAERVFGWNAQEIQGSSPPYIPLDRLEEYGLIRQRVLSGERLVGIEVEWRKRDGSPLVLSVSKAPVYDSDGKVDGVIAILEDISARKEAEHALIEAKRKAEEMAHLKSVFLANMSHEIRTPLTGIIGFAQVLADEVKNEYQRYAQMIGRSGQRLLETLNSILDLASLEAGSARPELTAVNVNPMIAEVCALFEGAARDKGLILESILSSGPLYARTDQTSLHRILCNLVNNAVKFTETGGVLASADAAGDHIRISIRDTGEGISESFLPRIFEEFRQESTGFARSHEGSGLGLTITRKLVDLVQGTIEVVSTKGKGSTFTVILPVSSPPETAGDTGAAPDRKTYEPSKHLAGRAILVAEDSEDSVVLYEELLGDTCILTVAVSAEEALNQAKRNTFDLVLLDVNLSGQKTGIDVLKEIRSISPHNRIPAIAVTAYALPEDRENLLQSGFDGYLAKPFDTSQLIALVSRHLR